MIHRSEKKQVVAFYETFYFESFWNHQYQKHDILTRMYLTDLIRIRKTLDSLNIKELCFSDSNINWFRSFHNCNLDDLMLEKKSLFFLVEYTKEKKRGVYIVFNDLVFPSESQKKERGLN